jgi:hypothetical protein
MWTVGARSAVAMASIRVGATHCRGDSRTARQNGSTQCYGCCVAPSANHFCHKEHTSRYVTAHRTAARLRRLAQRHSLRDCRSTDATASESGRRPIRGNHTRCEAYAVIRRREKPLHSHSSIGRLEGRPIEAYSALGRDNFRDNFGDRSVPATRSLAYT